MKKRPLSLGVVFILVSCMLFIMSCDDTTGLGGTPGNTPENVFAGGEWEHIYNSQLGGELLHYYKITFSADGFTYYEKANYPDSKNENTYTGSYSLSYDNINSNLPAKIMTLTSDRPALNGQVYYEYYETYTEMPESHGGSADAGEIRFYGTPNNSTVAIPNVFKKIN